MLNTYSTTPILGLYGNHLKWPKIWETLFLWALDQNRAISV